MDSQRVPMPLRRLAAASPSASPSSHTSGESSRLPPAPDLRGQRRSSRIQSGATLLTAVKPTVVNQQVVTALPQSPQPPAWLKLLIKVQQVSSVTVVVLGVATLSVYGWTVYVQQRWGQEYHRFETLKKQERQLISGNEALKNQIAQQAESPLSGLMVPDPTNAIFLSPAAPRFVQVPDRPVSSRATPTKPLGY